jgi:hypothetical protein
MVMPTHSQKGLRGLASGSINRKWYAFEGPSFPDAFIETPDALIVVEGKYTEVWTTTKTTWMTNRHQMLRHVDGAWEIRGTRSVYGIFIVDGSGESNPAKIPAKWETAYRDTLSPEALRSSLPHRKVREERQAIADCLVGITTWEAIQHCFNLDPVLLTKKLKPKGQIPTRMPRAGDRVLTFDYKNARRRESATDTVAEFAGEAVGGGWYVILASEMVVAVEAMPDNPTEPFIWLEKEPR